jgi:uncharacterized membrane protein
MTIFIAIGILDLTLRILKKKPQFDPDFSALAIVSFLVCIAAIAFPLVSNPLNTTRLYHLTLFLLAPFCILGALVVSKSWVRVWGFFSKRKVVHSLDLFYKVFSVVLAIFLLFNTGFVFEILQDHPYSLSLSQNYTKTQGTAVDRFGLYSGITPPEDVAGAVWLSSFRNQNLGVYADYRARNNVLNSYGMISRYEGNAFAAWGSETIQISSNSYVYLRMINVLDGVMGGSTNGSTGIDEVLNDTSFLAYLHGQSDTVYSNGATEISYSFTNITYNLNEQSP